MSQLTPIQLEDGTIIYIEASENVAASIPQPSKKEIETPDKLDFLIETPEEAERGVLEKLNLKAQGEQLQKTIQSYSKHIIQSFKDLALAEVSEVTLEFGVNVGGMTGIPYIVTGETSSNIKITVKCKFDKT
ncbi:CU044_2847 family protein [Anabaena cylindrica UHCC 0172]|uniref:CU044_2847 family protein n=1 Tax=Anabaena cylindrica TaxID=1165 RepID=UPI002B2071A7|nr:CU044_2847 family protein [Anabaena cylindrica]MEA5553051.1 CU044_2847 family protein [Anabaena cylindrica UHCC 0172]